MVFLITLCIVIVFSTLFRGALIKLPGLFYALALVLVFSYISLFFFGDLIPFFRAALPAFQRCLIGLAFFTLVMYVGVFPDESQLRHYFMPIRRQLSILGAIFTCGHVVVYSANLLPRLVSGVGFSRMSVSVSLLLALVLVLLLIPLTVTSFNAVKKRMKSKGWKRLQRLSYVFFGLIYVHLMFILVPTAIAGSTNSVLSIFLYSVLFSVYAILRVRKHVREKVESFQVLQDGN